MCERILCIQFKPGSQCSACVTLESLFFFTFMVADVLVQREMNSESLYCMAHFVQSKFKEMENSFMWAHISSIQIVLNFIMVNGSTAHFNRSTVMSFVNVFENVFHTCDCCAHLNINVTVILGITWDNILIIKGVVPDKDSVPVMPFLIWIAIYTKLCFICERLREAHTAVVIFHARACWVELAAWSMNHVSFHLFIECRLSLRIWYLRRDYCINVLRCSWLVCVLEEQEHMGVW